VPGLAGFSVKRRANASHCGGFEIVTSRGNRIAAADKQLAAVYAIEFPTGLNFDPVNNKAKEASLKRFNDFISKMTKTASAAAKFYADQIPAAGEAVKLAAVARVVQIQYRVASVLARAEIPKDVRTGEFKDDKVQAYCDRMIEVAEPLVARAEAALSTCVDFVKLHPSPGWWNQVCVP